MPLSRRLRGATYAYFSDTEKASGNSMQGGTLDLLINGQQGVTTGVFTVGDVYPGWVGTVQKFTVGNAGTIPGHVQFDKNITSIRDDENGKNDPESKMADTAVETGAGNLCRNLKVRVTDESGDTSVVVRRVSITAANESRGFILSTGRKRNMRTYRQPDYTICLCYQRRPEKSPLR